MIVQFKKYSFIILTIFTFSCNSNGQNKLQNQASQTSKIETAIKQKREPIEYGSGDVVTKGFLDKSGNMWFATTQEGIFRYDGTSFTNFTEKDGLCSNEVWAVIEDKEGFLWFGTANGLCKFNGKTFKNIPIPKDDTKSEWAGNQKS